MSLFKSESSGLIVGDDHRGYSAFTPVEIYTLLFLVSISVVCLDVVFYASTLEDAYITFRYSTHFADGYGLGAWNAHGERVEGYTSYLWMILIGAADAIGIEVRTAAKVIGIFMHLVLSLTLIAFPLLRQKSNEPGPDILKTPNEAVLAGVFLALYLPIGWYATSGMETVFFSALTGLALVSVYLRYSGFLLPLLSFLLVLTRPEGIVMAGAAILLQIIHSRREGRTLRTAWIAAGITIVSSGFLVAQRLVLFDDFVPNTYWAKAGGASLEHVRWGLRYVNDWASDHLFVILLGGVGALSIVTPLARKQLRTLPWDFVVIFFLVLAFIAYIIKVGGDNYFAFPYWRHFVHLAVPITLLACYGLTRIYPTSRYFHLLALLGIVVLTDLSVLRAHNSMMLKSVEASLSSYPVLAHDGHSEYLTRLKRISQPDTTIASGLAGELPYVVDATHIDILGLNTRHIAKHGSFDPKGPPDSKTDMPWVMEQHPDIIEGYIPGSMVLHASPNRIKLYIETNWRSTMLRELVSSPIFQREYLFVRNWPYQSMDRALFIKASYVARQRLREELDCIPVADTPLRMYANSPHKS